MGFLDYFGLTGKSVKVPVDHISANYTVCTGSVFVDYGDGWDRVLEKDVTQKMKVVKCRHCDKPAISLDHFYPYDTQNNRCGDHIND